MVVQVRIYLLCREVLDKKLDMAKNNQPYISGAVSKIDLFTICVQHARYLIFPILTFLKRSYFSLLFLKVWKVLFLLGGVAFW